MFRFKQFVVYDDSCSMKVGTDGTLLGAWTDVPTKCKKILDIGTGSGLIALMLAQRNTEAEILAIDIDLAATEQAQLNFHQSPWRDRLHAKQLSLQDLVKQESEHHQYDLIVSNPPYFVDSLKNPDEGRKTARHTDSLSFDDLLHGASLLLAENGLFSMVLPADTEMKIRELSLQNGLHIVRLTHVHTTARKPAKRILITLSCKVADYEQDSLCLIGEDGKPRSEQYSQLCKDFYL